MNRALIAIEVILGVLLLSALVFVVITLIRRRTISGGTELTRCGLRLHGRSRWKWGLLRLTDHYLEWYTAYGLTTYPTHRWPRGALDLFGMRELEETPSNREPVASWAVGVDFSVPQANAATVYGALALGRDQYMALRSWVESAPPGDLPVGG